MKKYKDKYDVYHKIITGQVKRSTIVQLKQRAKNRNDSEYFKLLEDGMKVYDNNPHYQLMCRVFKKPINDLTYDECFEVWNKHNEQMTHFHNIRHTIIVTTEDETDRVEDYTNEWVMYFEDNYL